MISEKRLPNYNKKILKKGENGEKRCEKEGKSKTCRMREGSQKTVEKKIKKISEQTLFGFVGDEFAEVSSGKRLLLSPSLFLPLTHTLECESSGV